MKQAYTPSWDHTVRRKHCPGECSCSVAGCKSHPRFEVSYSTSQGRRHHFYCRGHALQFARKYKVRMPPRTVREAGLIPLDNYTDDALRHLRDRIDHELARKSLKPVEFEFDEISDGASASPYVARLVLEKGQVKRRFLKFRKAELEDGSVRMFGSFELYPFDLVEMRGGNDQEWARYTLSDKGDLVFVATKGDSDSVARSEAMLQDRNALLSFIGK